VKFYEQFNLPDKDEFYWELLSKEDNIREIIKTVLNNYYIKDGSALAAKLSPFRSVVFRVPFKNTLDAITGWGETIINVRNNYRTIIKEFGDQVKLKHKSKTRLTTKGPGSWINAYEQLHNVSINKSVDSRVRVLATIYKYGYIFRMSTIFRTYIYQGDDTSRDKYNYLDLDNQSWTIIDGAQNAEIPIPVQMAREIQALTLGGQYGKGWLLPQRRGIPYASEASISSFSSWTKLGLSNYRSYRKMFNLWLREGVGEEEYDLFQCILDQNLNFISTHYMPPLPDIKLAEPEPEEQSMEPINGIGKELVPESGLEMDVMDSGADLDSFRDD
jgi:hypothetical protein